MAKSHHRIDLWAAAAVAAALLAVAVPSEAATPRAVLEGSAPSGAHYRFTWGRDRPDRLCERLSLGSTSTRNCQPRRGHGAHGLWTLDCRTLDFSVYGRTYRRRARVTLRSARGVVRARRAGRSAFLLTADGRGLPGTVLVRSHGGRVLRRLHFGGAQALCAGDPLDVTYVF